MAWRIEFDPRAKKELAQLDKDEQRRIVRFLSERVLLLASPRLLGEALHGSKFGGLWKYRVGDYRVVCDIRDHELKILVVRIGHRKEVYR